MAERFSTEHPVLPECERALLIVDFINPPNFDGRRQRRDLTNLMT